jgi:hypothetical protein
LSRDDNDGQRQQGSHQQETRKIRAKLADDGSRAFSGLEGVADSTMSEQSFDSDAALGL